MAFRIHDSVVRGEIDNRVKGAVRGRIWVHGRAEPVVLELQGNAHPDLAGCRLTFENPLPTTPHQHLESLGTEQKGTIGDLTASRKVRVFDLPFEEAYAMIKRGEKPPERMANCLYLEWFSEANGRVVIESTDYKLTISAPEWQMTPEEEEQRSREAASGFAGFMGTLTDALESARFTPPEDRPMDEFEWEKAFRESDALTDKAMELHEKFGDRPDFEEILAREMGWVKPDENGDDEARRPDVEEIDRICEEAEAKPLEPNPLTEGIDWVRDEDGDIGHPLEKRIQNGSMSLWHWCDEHGLLGENGSQALHDMLFKYQHCGAKCAGALGGLAYPEEPDAGFIVASLKRALALLHEALEASDHVAAEQVLPPERLGPFKQEMLTVRQEILTLMERFRGRKS